MGLASGVPYGLVVIVRIAVQVSVLGHQSPLQAAVGAVGLRIVAPFAHPGVARAYDAHEGVTLFVGPWRQPP
ncbi:MAG: hypothetical protein ABEJ76_04935 [Halanaeroarchaeum sp.]